MEFYYARDYGEHVTLDIAEIAAEVVEYPESHHHVWREGMDDWALAHSVPELAEALASIELIPRPEWGRLYRYSIDGRYQPAASAEEIAAQVRLQPDAVHKVWQDDYLWWPFAQEVPEIAHFGPLPPIPGDSEESVLFRVHKGTDFCGEMTQEQIVSLMREDPTGPIRIWRPGMLRWKHPEDVADFADDCPGSSEVEEDRMWLIQIRSEDWRDQTAGEVAELARTRRHPDMKIWRIGMKRWASPWEVDEIRALDIGESPVQPAERPWQYSGGGERLHNLSLDEVVQRIRAEPDLDHKVWRLGLERWKDPDEVEAFAGLLPEQERSPEPPRLLLHARNGTQQKYRTAEEILGEMEAYPADRHQVWPHLTERWLHPWEVEELQALGVQEPEDRMPEIWHHRQGDEQIPNREAGAIAISVIQHPNIEHLVWQIGWDRWEDPRNVPEIARMLPPHSEDP